MELAIRDPLCSPEQAAAFLGVKPQTLAVWRSTRRHGLPFVKVGRLVKYRASDLTKFIESRTVGAS